MESIISDKSEQTDDAKSKTNSNVESYNGKPLKGLLKKSSSSSSSSSLDNQPVKKEKKKVKFAETMMVFWDETPEDFFSSMKSSDFNLVEIASQEFMFEPPVEYQDLLPFDPPPDYRDCVQSSFPLFNSISCKSDSGINFIDEDTKNVEKISDEFNSASKKHWENKILNETELLEEDIIDVLKEDKILQAIGLQETDLDNVFHPTSHEDEWNEDDFPVHYQSEVTEEIQRKIVQSDKNSLSSEISSDIASETEEMCSDITSDSSFTSQETIILTNSICSIKKSQSGSNDESKVQAKSSIERLPAEYREIDFNLDFEPEISKPVLEIIHDEEDETDSEKKVNSKSNEFSECQKFLSDKKDEKDKIDKKNELQSKSKIDTNASNCTLVESQINKETSSLIKEGNSSTQYNITKTVSDVEMTSGTINLKKEEIRKSYPQKVSILEKKDSSTTNDDSKVSVTKIAESFEKREQQPIIIPVELRNNKLKATVLPRPKSFPSSSLSQSSNSLNLLNPVKVAKLTNSEMVENLKRLSLSNDKSNLGQFKDNLDLKSLPKEHLIIEYTSEPRGAKQGPKTRTLNTGQSKNKSVPLTCNPNNDAIDISNESKASLSPSASSLSSSSISNLTPNNSYKKSNLMQTCQLTQASINHLTPAVNQNLILHSPNCIQTCSSLNCHVHDLQTDTFQKQISQNVNIDPTKTCIISQQITPCNCSHPSFSIQKIVTHDPSQNPPNYKYYSIQPQQNCQQVNKQQISPVISHIVRYQIPNRQFLCIPRFHSTNIRPSFTPNQSTSSPRFQAKTIHMPIDSNSSLPLKASIHFASQSKVPLSNEQIFPMSKNFSFPSPKQIRHLDGLNPLDYNHLEELAKSGKIPVTLIKSGCSNFVSTNQATEAKDELVQFVEQDIQRIERIKKRYSLSDEDDDPTFGFGRRPSVRGIKPQYSTTNNILKQMQLHMRPCLNRTVVGKAQDSSLQKQRVFLSQNQLSNLQSSCQPRQVYLIPHQNDLIYSPRLKSNVSMSYPSQVNKVEQNEVLKQMNQELNLNLTQNLNESIQEEILIDKSSNSVSIGASKGLLTTTEPNNCFLHHKTISMPNVASIKSSPQILTIIPIKDERGTPEGASSSPTHTSDLPYMKITSPFTTRENKKDITILNTTTNTNNNPDLVKDVTSSSLKKFKVLKSCASPKENSDNVQSETANKEGVIYYSMNV